MGDILIEVILLSLLSLYLFLRYRLHLASWHHIVDFPITLVDHGQFSGHFSNLLSDGVPLNISAQR